MWITSSYKYIAFLVMYENSNVYTFLTHLYRGFVLTLLRFIIPLRMCMYSNNHICIIIYENEKGEEMAQKFYHRLLF